MSDSVTPWTVAHQAPLSKGFSMQEYWNGLPFSPPGDLPNPGIKPTSLKSPTLAGGFFTTSTTLEALQGSIKINNYKLVHNYKLVLINYKLVHKRSVHKLYTN